MNKNDKINELAKQIVENFPRIHQETEPFRVLVTTILSQRSKDENTEIASRQLFEKFDSIEKIAFANPEELYDLIKPSGLYTQKAKNIIEVSKMILENYSGNVPNSLEELLKLPGVGRKTANIVLYVSFGIPALAVDTHVHRISNRLGWVKTKIPEQTEKALCELLQPSLWGPINGSMVEFGKKVCKPVSPKCQNCFLKNDCKYFKNNF